MSLTLVRGGTVVSSEGRRAADVLCEDGRIAAVLDPGAEVAADEVVDATGLLVFPGFIDPHIHPRDPGDTHKEDFAHASRAAAVGGITTLLVMPNAAPPVTDVASYRRRAEEHGAVAHVDFGLWGLSLGMANIGDLAGLFAEGAVAVKLFWGYALDKESKRLVYNTADKAPEDVIPPATTGEVMQIFQAIAAADGILAAHCEDRDILDVAQRELGHAPQAYSELKRRPSGRGRVELGRRRHRARPRHRRPLPRVPHQLRAGDAPRAAGAAGRPAGHRRDVPALPAVRRRRLRRQGRRDEGVPAGPRGGGPRRAVGRRRGRHDRLARLGPRAAHAGGQDPGLRDGAGRHGRRRDDGPAAARPDERRPHHAGAPLLGGQRGDGAGCTGSTRRRASSPRAPTRTSRWSTRTRRGRSAARSCTACRSTRRSRAPKCAACPS